MSQDNLLVGTDEGVLWNATALEDSFTRSTLSFSTLLTAAEITDAQISFVSSVQNLETDN